MSECKSCEYCDLMNNRCFNDDTICYKNGKCLRIGCRDYVEGKWMPQDLKEGVSNENNS